MSSLVDPSTQGSPPNVNPDVESSSISPEICAEFVNSNPDGSSIRPSSSYIPATTDWSKFAMCHNPSSKQHQTIDDAPQDIRDIAKPNARAEIAKGVVRKKLAKMRHLVLKEGISPAYLDSIMPSIMSNFFPQKVNYNGGIANIKEWKISCYLEVMDGGVPCTNPCKPLLDVCVPLLDTCDALFIDWYKQQHACNKPGQPKRTEPYNVKRVMTFITRYTAYPDEQALLKHVDGAGKVDGSVVVALPVDRWSGPEEVYSFEGHGGGLTFWDGSPVPSKQTEIRYDTRSGDVGFIDKAVWHQANPITKGTRWALVIFYEVR